MTLSLTLGWWLLPSLLTLAAFVWAFVERKTDYQGLLGGLPVLFRLVVAIIVSLMGWVLFLAWRLALA